MSRSHRLRARAGGIATSRPAPEPIVAVELPPELVEQLARALARALVKSIRRDPDST